MPPMNTIIPSKNLPAVARDHTSHCMADSGADAMGRATGPGGDFFDVSLDGFRHDAGVVTGWEDAAAQTLRNCRLKGSAQSPTASTPRGLPLRWRRMKNTAS